jgi:membrane fusion protein, heavy metal efflux system
MKQSAMQHTLTLAVLGVVAAVAGCDADLNTTIASGDGADATEASPRTQEQIVHLTEDKLASAAIHVVPIATESLEDTHRVPGRIDYDAARRLEVRVPVDCMVERVLAVSGQQVKTEQPLAILSSAEVGLARSTIRQRGAELEIAQAQHQRVVQVADNVQQLLDELAELPLIDQLQEAFRGRSLGVYRDQLMTAYSELLLAEQRASGGQNLQEMGVLSGRTLQQRQNDLDVARVAFQTACEESSHQASLQKSRTAADVAQAERMLQISNEHLQALLGPFSDQSRLDDETLNEFVLCSPMDGTIEEQHAVAGMQVMENTPLFRLANIDVVWVRAGIHSRRWAALSARTGQDLQVQSQAFPDQRVTARVKFVGTSVSPDSLSIPLVAELDNTDHWFKPGMFVWVTVPMAEPRSALAVPPSAILRHEGQTFVFVAEDDLTFRRRDVTTGLDTTEWVEITAGLRAGERVVDGGAFYLKSELFLEREAD